MKVQLTNEETELLVLAGLLAEDSPIPLLKHEIEKCTVTISENGVDIEITYKLEEGDEDGASIHGRRGTSEVVS